MSPEKIQIAKLIDSWSNQLETQGADKVYQQIEQDLLSIHNIWQNVGKAREQAIFSREIAAQLDDEHTQKSAIDFFKTLDEKSESKGAQAFTKEFRNLVGVAVDDEQVDSTVLSEVLGVEKAASAALFLSHVAAVRQPKGLETLDSVRLEKPDTLGFNQHYEPHIYSNVGTNVSESPVNAEHEATIAKIIQSISTLPDAGDAQISLARQQEGSPHTLIAASTYQKSSTE